jgi:glycosyltransferase involved in cell wall biosynthesis
MRELIILDDSPRTNQDIIDAYKTRVPNIRYLYEQTKMPIGAKRNKLNKHAKGDVIVCMDDDDYQSPERIQHTVDMFAEFPDMLIAGSSILPLYFPEHPERLYELGPYAEYHSLACSMAYRRKYLSSHSFYNTSALAEESHFTNGFKEPMIQLDPRKVVVCISHGTNTVDKHSFQYRSHNPHHTIRDYFYVNDAEILEMLTSINYAK